MRINNKLIILTIFALSLIAGCVSPKTTNEVDVKYRETPVNIADSAFEELDTSKSSWIEGAWYDEANEYMIIDLDGTKYHYCDFPEYEWESFKDAESYGKYYNANIKGQYGCANQTVNNEMLKTSAPLEIQEKCANKADEWAKEHEYDEKSLLEDSYQNHFNQKLNKCFIKMTHNGFGDDPSYFITIEDIYENVSYASFMTVGDRLMLCHVNGVTCESEVEFEKLAKSLLED